MEKFAGYGFNKSHAAAYSLLAYHTAWLKVHYTAEFFAANMTVEIDNTDKLKVLLEDARRPSASTLRAARRQRAAPTASSRCRRQARALRPGRDQGHRPGRDRGDRRGARGAGRRRSRSLFDFCARVDRGRINKRVVEALIKAGAFDALHPDRARRCSRASACALRLGRDAGRARRPGRPVRLRSTTRRTARARRSRRWSTARAVEHQGAADAREVGARLLPLGPPVRPERGRGAPLRASCASPT